MNNLLSLLRAHAALRFLLGAGVGLAVSIPLYAGVEDWPVRLGLMLAFGGIFGVGSALGSGKAVQRPRVATWLVLVGVLILGMVVAVLFVTR